MKLESGAGMQGHEIYTSGGGDTNMAVVAACLEAQKLEQLTVILPQSLSKQPEEIQGTLSQVPSLSYLLRIVGLSGPVFFLSCCLSLRVHACVSTCVLGGRGERRGRGLCMRSCMDYNGPCIEMTSCCISIS